VESRPARTSRVSWTSPAVSSLMPADVAYAATLARRRTASAAVAAVTSDLDENLPASVLRHLDGLISAHTARD
jgi:hypothetical protein